MSRPIRKHSARSWYHSTRKATSQFIRRARGSKGIRGRKTYPRGRRGRVARLKDQARGLRTFQAKARRRLSATAQATASSSSLANNQSAHRDIDPTRTERHVRRARRTTVKTVRRTRSVARAGARVARAGARRGAHTARGAARAAQVAARAVKTVAMKIIAAALTLVTSLITPAIIPAIIVVSVVSVVAAVLSFLLPNAAEEVERAQTASVVGMVDDYPWKDEVRSANGTPTAVYNTVNPHTHYYYGNCTDFVFWRVNRDMGASVDHWKYTHASLTPLGGHGKEWGKSGNLAGWQTITNPEMALQGDIISFQSGAFGHEHWAGHVAYVSHIAGGQLVTENYGNAQYYIQRIDLADLKKAIRAGTVVLKRNSDLIRAGGAIAALLPPASGSGASVVNAAQGLIGLPYGRGAGKGSADCCWTVFLSYQRGRGISLPMSTRGMPWAQAKCEYAMYSRAHEYGGVYVPADLEHLSPGDILFFQQATISPAKDNLTHVAIYAGGGQIIDAIPRAGVSLRPLRFSGSSTVLQPQAVHVP